MGGKNVNVSLERPHDLTSEGGALADIREEVIVGPKGDTVGAEEVPNKPGSGDGIKNQMKTDSSY